MNVQALLRKAATALDAERARIDRQREALRAVLNGVGGGAGRSVGESRRLGTSGGAVAKETTCDCLEGRSGAVEQ